ncbi:MAG TPA: cysteine hydrolase family protein [Dongiaceae bacterium]|nr:cysteine hydrolase family protein [Dongiaceae bacterium]
MTAQSSGKTALLLIDIQLGLINAPQGLHEAETVIGRCADLLRRARASGVPVLHVQHHEEGSELERLSPDWYHHPAVAPVAGEPVVEKETSSAFVSGELDLRLKEAGVKQLVIAGLQTEYCIDTNCRVARNLGYDVILAADAHSTYDGGGLTAAQIIAHHNRVLGSSTVTLWPAADIVF